MLISLSSFSVVRSWLFWTSWSWSSSLLEEKTFENVKKTDLGLP